jgi:uncharacterized SAM-binding protein YcdF (DUF218 family)
MRWLRWTGLAALGIAALGAAGFLAFLAALPKHDPAESVRTDAIVVLTGGQARIAEGMRLFRADMAERVLISGVHDDVDLRTLLDAHGVPPGDAECCVDLGHAARSTRGNARETAAWLRKHGYTSARLVTADYHMPRSLRVFRRHVDGIRLIPHPVEPPRVRDDPWWRSAKTARLLAREYGKYLLTLVRDAFTPSSREPSA